MENNQNKYHIESNQIVVANGINHGIHNDIGYENDIVVETHGRASLRMTEYRTARIDTKKSKTEKLIELLTEHRTALISKVVTGKIKVTE